MRRLALKLDDDQTKFVAFVVVAAAFATSAIFAYQTYRAHVVSSYPLAEGVVSRCETETVLTTHSVSIHYRYVVSGQTYHGFDHTSSKNRDRIEEIAERFASHAKVDVRYNPSNASDSYLVKADGDADRPAGVVDYALGFLYIVFPLLVVGGAFAVACVWQSLTAAS